MSASRNVVLHQFPMSHYNEKVRWALDWKGIAHRREHYLPGPHARAIEKLSGQSSTPVLALDGDVVSGSAAILERLEADYPEPSLLPTDAAQRREALELQKRFDDEVGPATRTALFSVLMNESAYVAKMFGSPQPAARRFLYRMIFPLARGKVRAAYQTNDRDHVARCEQVAVAALDEVAERSAATGYLVGDSFTVADLTCAALLAPIAGPEHPDMKRPSPRPETVRRYVARFEDHPGVQWVRSTYERDRPGRATA
ncbi:MAG: glutathione S-transferase family protein [Acidobacteriota bacterium]